MSLTADRALPSPAPNRWRMRETTLVAIGLGTLKLAFSTGLLAFAAFVLKLGGGALQSFAFVTLVFGNQAALFALRDQRHMWQSRPGAWVIASSLANIIIVTALALSGTMMAPLAGGVIAAILPAAVCFCLIFDQAKRALGAALWAD